MTLEGWPPDEKSLLKLGNIVEKVVLMGTFSLDNLYFLKEFKPIKNGIPYNAKLLEGLYDPPKTYFH